MEGLSELVLGTVDDDPEGLPLHLGIAAVDSTPFCVVATMVLDLAGLNAFDLVTEGLSFIIEGFGLTATSFFVLAVFVGCGTRPEVLGALCRDPGLAC